MIKAFIAWLHRITAPPTEVKVGDVWVYKDDGPWCLTYEVLEILDGWVRCKSSDRGFVFTSKIDGFRSGKRLKSRNGVPQ
jgi:hypothetical protein